MSFIGTGKKGNMKTPFVVYDKAKKKYLQSNYISEHHCCCIGADLPSFATIYPPQHDDEASYMLDALAKDMQSGSATGLQSKRKNLIVVPVQIIADLSKGLALRSPEDCYE